VLVVAAPTRAAHAADITDVASSAEKNNPFDLRLEIAWSHDYKQAKITRENQQVDPKTGQQSIVDVTELRYRRVLSQILPTLRIGLYHDLEIHVTLPVVLADDASWWPAALKGLPQNSTIHNAGGLCANGQVDASCAGDLFPFTQGSGKNNSFRGGLGDGTLGLTWGILSEKRDKWDPRWNIGFDWTFPSGGKRNPADVSHSSSTLKPVGLETNFFTFSSALSKRIGGADPFLRFWYRLPVPTNRAYSNCDNPNLLADQNIAQAGVQTTCDVAYWSKTGKNHAGFRPAHRGGIDFGSEFIPYEDPAEFVKLSIQLSFGAEYISEARGFSELSDALGKLTYTQQYMHFYGTLGFHVQASQYAKFHLLGTFAHDTQHLLTTESVGHDMDGTGLVELTPDKVNPEQNPNYDFRYDQPGRRFIIEETTHFTLYIMGEVDF